MNSDKINMNIDLEVAARLINGAHGSRHLELDGLIVPVRTETVWRVNCAHSLVRKTITLNLNRGEHETFSVECWSLVRG